MQRDVLEMFFVGILVIGSIYETADSMNSRQHYLEGEDEFLPCKRVMKLPSGKYVYRDKKKKSDSGIGYYAKSEWKELSKVFHFSKPLKEIRFRAYWVQKITPYILIVYLCIFVIGEILKKNCGNPLAFR